MALHKKKFVVRLAGQAAMHGYLEVEAFNSKEAEEAALEKIGDASWSYDGMIDETVEAWSTSVSIDQRSTPWWMDKE